MYIIANTFLYYVRGIYGQEFFCYTLTMKNDLVKKGYDKAAGHYAQTRNQFESIKYLEIFSKLVDKGKTILDIGCGAGKPVDEFLVNRGFAVNGIDIST